MFVNGKASGVIVVMAVGIVPGLGRQGEVAVPGQKQSYAWIKNIGRISCLRQIKAICLAMCLAICLTMCLGICLTVGPGICLIIGLAMCLVAGADAADSKGVLQSLI